MNNMNKLASRSMNASSKENIMPGKLYQFLRREMLILSMVDFNSFCPRSGTNCLVTVTTIRITVSVSINMHPAIPYKGYYNLCNHFMINDILVLVCYW